MYDYSLMESYTLNFEAIDTEKRITFQIQEQFQQVEGKHLLASIHLSKLIPLEHILQIVRNLPTNFVGIDLLPFVANLPLEFLEKILAALPAHIHYLNADHLITDYLNPLSAISNEFPYDLFKKILLKVPKTIREFSFKNNLERNLPGYLELIARYLPQVRSLDLQGNYLEQLHSKQIPGLWINLPMKISVLLLSFTPPVSRDERDTVKRDTILNQLPREITQLILSIRDFRTNTHEQLNHCFGTLSSSVKKIQWTYEEIDEPFYLVKLIKNTPETVSILDLRDLDLGSFNYCAKDIKRGKPGKLIVDIINNIPAHVSTLLLDRNGLDSLTVEEFVLLISIIPATVTQVSLKGNNLFTNKPPSLQESILERIMPYTQSSVASDGISRIILDDNDLNYIALAYPLEKSLGHDIIYKIGRDLGSPITFFKSAAKNSDSEDPSDSDSLDTIIAP
ncbi:MAG: hypothetical protein J0I93_08345 [Legionella sp.]|nr:hypothetical protein [Legionella sp.]